MIASGQRARVLATITPTTVFDNIPLVRGATIIYGYITRVGGNPPKARISQLNGDGVSCDLSRELARDLGSHLYTWVGLKGTATWQADDFHLEAFEIDSVTEYQERPLAEAFQAIAAEFGEYFLDIDDVDAYIQGREARSHLSALVCR